MNLCYFLGAILHKFNSTLGKMSNQIWERHKQTKPVGWWRKDREPNNLFQHRRQIICFINNKITKLC